MKRGGPIKRKTPMKRGTSQLKSKVGLKRSWWNPKRKAEPKTLTESKKIVRERSDGRCEARVPGVCTGEVHDPHHIQPKGRGGGHEVENLMAICRSCHRWADEHMAEATEMGLIRSGAKPFGAYMLSSEIEMDE